MTGKVSIVVPVYNASKNLRRCILSILSQSYKNIEVVAVDDGSKDNSYLILQELALKDERLIIISQDNQGVSSARNRAIKICTGEFLQFVDADDYLDVGYVEQLVKSIEDYELVISNYKLVTNNIFTSSEMNLKKYKTKDAFVRDIHKIYVKNLLNALWNKLFKNSLVKENELLFNNSVNMGEDLLFVLSYLEYANKINSVCLDSTYNYVNDAEEQSLTKRFDFKYLEMYEYINSALLEFVIASGTLNTEQKDAFNSGYTSSIVRFILIYLNQGEINRKTYNKIYSEINLDYICLSRLSRKSRLILKLFNSRKIIFIYFMKILIKLYLKLKMTNQLV